MNCGGPPGGVGTCKCDPWGSCPWRDTSGVAKEMERIHALPAADRMTAFKEAYGALCRKYNVIVDACGCFDSPWMHADPDKRKCPKPVQKHLDDLKPLEVD